MHEVLLYKAPKAGNAKHIRFANKKRAQVSSMWLFHYEARHTSNFSVHSCTKFSTWLTPGLSAYIQKKHLTVYPRFLIRKSGLFKFSKRIAYNFKKSKVLLHGNF